MKFADFCKQMMDVKDPVRDQLALKAMLDGNTPSWAGVPEYECTTEALLDGVYYQCKYRVMRNYLPIGEDGDSFTDWGVWPLTQKSITKYCEAKQYKWYMPTKKLVFNTWLQSRCKINPQPISRVTSQNPTGHPGTGTETILTENRMLFDAMAHNGCPWNTFTRGLKEYAVKPGQDGSMQYFGGWYWPGGTGWQAEDPGWHKAMAVSGGTFGKLIQDFNDAHHDSNYEDYSQGVDLIYYQCDVNGAIFDYADLCAHPKLWVLVSDAGPFVPKFPNVGLSGPASPPPLPQGKTAPASFQGPEFKTTASGNVALVKAGAFLATPGEPVSSSKKSSGLGVFFAALGIGWIATQLINRAQPRPAY